MGYDYGDSFPLDFEPNGISFGSKSKYSFLSVGILPLRDSGFQSGRET